MGDEAAARKAGRLLARSLSKAKQVAASPAVQEAGKKAVTRYLGKAQGRAGKLLQNKDRLLSLASRGDQVTGDIAGGPMAGVSDELRALIRLIRAYAGGQYREVPWESMVLIVAAVGYVVSPIDLVPDFVPGIGGLDDLTVVRFVLQVVRRHLDEFVAWEQNLKPGAAPP